MRDDDRDPLLDQRAALILMFGVLIGLGTGGLTVLNDGTLAGGALAGGGAFAAAVYFFHKLIG